MTSNSDLRLPFPSEAFNFLGLSLRQEGISSSVDMSESGEDSTRNASLSDRLPTPPYLNTSVCAGSNKDGTNCQRSNITTTKRYKELIENQKGPKTTEQIRRERFCKQHGDKDAEEQAQMESERLLAEQQEGLGEGSEEQNELPRVDDTGDTSMVDIAADSNTLGAGAKQGTGEERRLPAAAAIAYPEIHPQSASRSRNHDHIKAVMDKKLGLTVTSALHTLTRDIASLQTVVTREGEENRRSRAETEKALRIHAQEQKYSEHAFKNLGQMVTSALSRLTQDVAQLQTAITVGIEEREDIYLRRTETKNMLRSIIIQTQKQKRGEAQVYPVIDEMKKLLVHQGKMLQVVAGDVEQHRRETRNMQTKLDSYGFKVLAQTPESKPNPQSVDKLKSLKANFYDKYNTVNNAKDTFADCITNFIETVERYTC